MSTVICWHHGEVFAEKMESAAGEESPACFQVRAEDDGVQNISFAVEPDDEVQPQTASASHIFYLNRNGGTYVPGQMTLAGIAQV